jgi:hypothetical protein
MSSSSDSNRQIEISKQVEVFIYRTPKQHHDTMVRVNELSKNFFRKHGALKFEVFILNSNENMMDL